VRVVDAAAGPVFDWIYIGGDEDATVPEAMANCPPMPGYTIETVVMTDVAQFHTTGSRLQYATLYE